MKRLDHYWYSINLISLLLLPLSGLFCGLSKLRVLLYQLKLLKSYKAPVPVIVIGNISVGGTGKTPLIIELVKQLRSKGRSPGVISRGYGGKSDTWPQLVNAQTTAYQVGDEPQLIYQHCHCPVSVGPDRKQSIEHLLAAFNCDVILSDDGLQHYALQRDIEVVVVDAQRAFGNGFCIPAGPLREMPSRLKQVDMVVFNGGDKHQLSFALQATQCDAVGLAGSLADTLVESQAEDRAEDRAVPASKCLADFSGQKVHAIAGIGHPQRFFNMLAHNGIEVIEHAFTDHHLFSESELIFNDELSVLMTQKDAIKCTGFTLPNHWSVAISLVLSAPAQQQLERIFDSL